MNHSAAGTLTDFRTTRAATTTGLALTSEARHVASLICQLNAARLRIDLLNAPSTNVVLELRGAAGGNSAPIRVSMVATGAVVECVACAAQVEIGNLTRQLKDLGVSPA